MLSKKRKLVKRIVSEIIKSNRTIDSKTRIDKVHNEVIGLVSDNGVKSGLEFLKRAIDDQIDSNSKELVDTKFEWYKKLYVDYVKEYFRIGRFKIKPYFLIVEFLIANAIGVYFGFYMSEYDWKKENKVIISNMVIDVKSRKPIKNVSVIARYKDSVKESKTDEKGVYSFEFYCQDQYCYNVEISYAHEAYMLVSKTFSPTGDFDTLNITYLTPAPYEENH